MSEKEIDSDKEQGSGAPTTSADTPAVTHKLLDSLPHTAKFVHLRVHSAYSLLEGALKVQNLTNACMRFNTPAMAITDRNNLFGALEIADNFAGIGVQSIIGVTLSVYQNDEAGNSVPESTTTPNAPTTSPTASTTPATSTTPYATSSDKMPTLALYAQNEQGYQNLMSLVSMAHLEAEDTQPPGVSLDAISRHHEGLICLSGGTEGLVNRLLSHGQTEKAESYLLNLNNIFQNRLYVELQRYGNATDDTNKGDDADSEAQLISFAYAHDIPLVATNQCFFESEEDYEAHDALICIAEGTYTSVEERRRLTPHHRLKTPAEMVSLFADLPEAVENTLEIARRCAFRPEGRDPILPPFAIGAEASDEIEELRRQAESGLTQRLQQGELAVTKEDYTKRLDFELDVITRMGFSGYFLIVADFIKWSKDNKIAVGPGRGSGAGSVVAWALTITDLDPLRFNLLFERFLNPERVSMPDFDIDFCQSRRDEVIRYVQQKYGRDQVAQIITFGKLQARAVLRDVGRVLQMPYGQVDRLCKMIPNNPANPVTLAEAIESEPRLQEARDSEAAVAQLLDFALKLEGLYRHASTHAAGVVIGDRPLQELVALYRDPKSDMPVTQFNMKWVEKAGLVKFDFLGLKTLTVLERAMELLAADGIKIDVNHLPLDDAKTYEMLGRGDTVGVFQLESAGMRDVLRKMHPDCFEDIIALVALYRPGPMENIPRYIACKMGEEEPDYMHELLQPVLQETYGVPVYQEQVMQIAQTISGYTLGEADLLRRAMGKKIKSEMQAQKKRFIEGAQENGLDKKAASAIFDQVDRFAGYGFNKSHAAAYAVVAYQTAYLKANHPVAFLAASMSLDYHNTDKLQVFAQDAAVHDIKVSTPDINRSGTMFETAENEILYALAAIRNVGRQAVAEIIAERQEHGRFTDVFDFAKRVGKVGLNSRMLENMIAAGAFDSLEADRARLMAGADMLLAEANFAAKEIASQQENLFGDAEVRDSQKLPFAESWSPVDRLVHEFSAVGFYLSGHPLDDYANALRRCDVLRFEDLADSVKKDVLIAGTIGKVEERRSQKGNQFAFLGLSDPTGQFEVIVFSETLSDARELLVAGNSVVLSVKLSHKDDQLRLQAAAIRPIDEVVAHSAAGLRIFVEKPAALKNISTQLTNAEVKGAKIGAQSSPQSGSQSGGGGSVSLIMQNDRYEIEVKLAQTYAITPRVSGAIKALSGVLHVEDL